MFTQRLNKKYQGETGIALVMAVFITLFLVAISLAYVVCSKTSLNQSQLSQGKVKSVVVAEAGMERALWCLQERADTVPGTITEANLLDSNYGNYDELLKNYQDKDKAAIYGVIIPGLGANTRYAARTVLEDDGNANNGQEVAIYVIGVDRIANITGKESSTIQGMKMLLRIGAREGGMPKSVVSSGDQINFSANSKVQVEGTLYSDKGVDLKANVDTSLKNPYTGRPLVQDPFTSRQNGNLLESKKWDGLIEDTTVSLEGPWATTGTKDITATNGDKIPVITTQTPQQNPPDFNVADFGVSVPMAQRVNGDGKYWGPDYTYTDLTSGKNWYKGNKLTGKPTTAVDGVLIPPSAWITIYKNLPPTVTDASNILYDKNGDGYTTVYLGPSDPNLRIVGNIYVDPGSRGIIASEGKGSNFYTDRADYATFDDYVAFANSSNYLNLTNNSSVDKWNGKDVYGSEDGLCLWHGSPYSQVNPDHIPLGADLLKNSNVGVELRGSIISGLGTFVSKPVYIDAAIGTDTPQSGGLVGKTITPYPNNRMGEGWGALSIIANNDIIISDKGYLDQETDSDFCSIFRGLIYSKNNIKIQSDILFEGMMIGCKSTSFADPAKCGYGLAQYCDGWDTSLYREDPFVPSGNGISFLPNQFNPCISSNTREMVVLSWETAKYYKAT